MNKSKGDGAMPTPFTYLIFPFYVKEGRNSDFIDKLKKSKIWGAGRITNDPNKEKFRETRTYPYVQRFFNTFIEQSTSNEYIDFSIYALKPLEDLESMYIEWIEETLLLDLKGHSEPVEFGICHKKDTFDGIKLMINEETGVGLVVLPLSVRATSKDFTIFMNHIRNTSEKNISISGNEDRWSLNEKVNLILKEVEGLFVRFNNDLALHITCLVRTTEFDEVKRNTLISIVKGKPIEEVDGKERVALCEMSRDYIGVASDGAVLSSFLDWNQNCSKDILRDYRTRQTERYMIFFFLLMQRYSLIRLVQNLSETNRFVSKGSENGLKILRKQIRMFSKISMNTYFTVVSEDSDYNDFYQMSCYALSIDKLSEEAKQKTELLNSYMTQMSDMRKEVVDLLISVILAVLTVTSAVNDLLGISEKIPGGTEAHRYFVAYSLGIIILAWAFYWIIRKSRSRWGSEA